MPCFKFGRKTTQPSSPRRKVYVGNKVPPDELCIVPDRYPNNRIITSKYTAYNFVFKNLFDQFRRIANFYFLCIAIIQLTINSPVSPATSLVPLIFVVSVTAIKQGYEDWLRHKCDSLVNNTPCIVYRDGKLTNIKSRDIQVGDIVMVKADEEVPCDLVLLSSSSASGECHITTANLDGETNLKVQKCAEASKTYSKVEDFKKFYSVIECEHPNAELYKFHGKLTMYYDNEEERVCSLTPVNLLLKGSSLKNTTFVYGCAVYTGEDTKMVLNLKLTSNKFSTVEKTMNKYLLVFLAIMVSESSVGIMLLVLSNQNEEIGKAPYIPDDMHTSSVGAVIEDFLCYLVLFNYIIPISLYVTLEMIKFIGAKFFTWDLELYNDASGEPAICNSSDLNEELGQVQYLFTDKTGTLTENEMQFRKCAINGVSYEEVSGRLYICPNETASADAVHGRREKGRSGKRWEDCVKKDLKMAGRRKDDDQDYDQQHQQTRNLPKPAPVAYSGHSREGSVEKFLLVLALCNTVQIKKVTTIDDVAGPSSETREYFASSPDEKALVEACARFGVVLSDINENEYTIVTKTGVKVYKKLLTLEFTPERKKMSVIVQDEFGSITLLCKGADSAVMEHLTSGNISDAEAHIQNYTMAGYRTLVIAKKPLSLAEYTEFYTQVMTARCEITDDDEQIYKLFDDIEKGMKLLGVTAVEDKLQDGVADTIESLRIAGIKVFVLTGDHQDTALNVCYACDHIKRDMLKFYVVRQQDTIQCYFTLKRIQSLITEENPHTYALIIDGGSLIFAFKDHCDILQSICVNCSAVLCCRMSPLQKSQMVKLIKSASGHPVTAAIGDGANDVSMIQEAHVGLGIMGKEGRQATRCSDFAFSRFRYLKRVFLIHGQYYYMRASTLVQYYFYKNIAFVCPQFIFIFYNGYTPQPLYASVFLMLYNIFFSSLPIFIFGFTEKHDTEENLMQNPALYRKISCNSQLSIGRFSIWFLQGIWHAVVIYYGVYFIWSDVDILSGDGLTLGVWTFSTIMFHILVVIVNLKLGLHTKHWTIMFLVSLVASVVGFILFSLVYTGIYWSVSTSKDYQVYIMALSSAQVWLCIVILVVVALLPDVLLILLQRHNFHFWTNLRHVFNSIRRPCVRYRKHNDQNGITLSQIIILNPSSNAIS